MYAVAEKYTPLFNHNNPKVLTQFDERLLNRSIEMVAFPKTVFQVHEESREMLLVSTEEFLPARKFYLFNSFVRLLGKKPKEREKKLLRKNELLERLESFPKRPYIWGGNVPDGVEELVQLLEKSQKLSPFQREYLKLKGVDCSGLLYYVTNGCLPRNTSQLIEIGEPVEELKPLDLIIWPGHVMIALSNNRIIESCESHGIKVSDQKKRLFEVEDKNPTFIRWY